MKRRKDRGKWREREEDEKKKRWNMERNGEKEERKFEKGNKKREEVTSDEIEGDTRDLDARKYPGKDSRLRKNLTPKITRCLCARF